ncbi:HD domain-containing protein [Vibrio sp. SCSIO 43132]|uniref:HD domain-containing protein n=1 Tax=Vibrio sp. SCSIO 43132 TaxID=2779363 RepID=UPI001CA8469E|nr:HD domain-containing protein [Vibrio sp. SCSIO 43132]UAB72237.1 HD domain-containing protein [Vibrio sp. SCSIO 43132]
MISDYKWSESTNGILLGKDKWQFYGLLIKGQCHETIQRLIRFCGGHRKAISRINLSSIPEPDTLLAKKAMQLSVQSCEPELYLHCLRTYYFGAMFAQFKNQKPDLELLYVASLMHDIGLTENYKEQARHTSFAVSGARAAYDLAEQFEYRESWRIELYEAISKHLNPYLSSRGNSIESICLQKGATLDVIGAYHFLFPKDQIAKLNNRFPRDEFQPHILDTIVNVPHHSCSHAGILSCCGFKKLVQRNPLDSSIVTT